MEELTGGRVTRSLRKRLTSVDSDGSRPGTPIVTKLTNIAETNEANNSLRVVVRRTPVKLKYPKARVQTPVKPTATDSPVRRMTRRISVTLTDGDSKGVDVADDGKAGGGAAKSAIDHMKSVATTPNTPARRSTRRNSASDDERTTLDTKIVKVPQYEAVDEREEEKELGESAMETLQTPKSKKVGPKSSSTKKSSTKKKRQSAGDSTENDEGGDDVEQSRLLSLSNHSNSDVEMIDLELTEQNEKDIVNTATPKATNTPIFTIDITKTDERKTPRQRKTSSSEIGLDSKETEKKNVQNKLKNISSPSVSASALQKTPLKNVDVEMEDISNSGDLQKSPGSVGMCELSIDCEKSKSVKFDSLNGDNLGKTIYPKTPIASKQKSYNIKEQNEVENESFESANSMVFLQTGKSNRSQIDSPSSVDGGENNEDGNAKSLGVKTPHNPKILIHHIHVQSSTPIVGTAASAADVQQQEQQDECDDEIKLVCDISPDKLLRSGKVYGSTPTPPKSTPTPTKSPIELEKSMASIKSRKSLYAVKEIPNSATKIDGDDKEKKTKAKRLSESSMLMTEECKEDNSKTAVVTTWVHGVTKLLNEKNSKIDEIDPMDKPISDSNQNTIIENTQSTTTATAKPAANANAFSFVNHDSEDGDDDENDNNSLILDRAEDAGDDYRSGDSMDEEERRELEENEIVDEGESIGTEDTEEDECDDDEENDKNSFIVSTEDEKEIAENGDDDEDGRVEFSADEEEIKEVKVYKRIQRRESVSNSSGEGDQNASAVDVVVADELKKPESAKKAVINSNQFDEEIALEIEQLIDDVFSSEELSDLNYSKRKTTINKTSASETKDSKEDSLLKRSANEDNRKADRRSTSGGLSLNQSPLGGDSPMNLQVDSDSDGAIEDEAQLNSSRKKILNEMNRSERFNRTFIEKPTEDDESDDEIAEISNKSAEIKSANDAKKIPSPRDQNKSANYMSSGSDDDAAPISASILLQKRQLYQSSSDDDDDDSDEVQKFSDASKNSKSKQSPVEKSRKSQSLLNISNASKRNESMSLDVSKKNESMSLDASKKKNSSLLAEDYILKKTEKVAAEKRKSLSGAKLSTSINDTRDGTISDDSRKESAPALNVSQKRQPLNASNVSVKSSVLPNILGEADSETDDSRNNNNYATEEANKSVIMNSSTKNVSFAEGCEKKGRTSHLLSKSFGVLEQKFPKKKLQRSLYNSFTVGDMNAADDEEQHEDFNQSLTTGDDVDDEDEDEDEEKEEANEEECIASSEEEHVDEHSKHSKYTSAEEERSFSSEDEHHLQQIAQIQKLNEITSVKKQRKSLLLMPSVEETKKKKKQRKASLPYSGELNPSQSFVETITEHKRRKLHEDEQEKRKKRLSKSFSGITVSESTSTVADSTVHDEHEKAAAENVVAVESPTTSSSAAAAAAANSKSKFENDGKKNIEHILKRCDEMLSAANLAKLQFKTNAKKNNPDKKQKKKKAAKSHNALKTIITSSSDNSDNQSSEGSMPQLTHSMIEKKEKTASAIKQALKASTEILLKNVKTKIDDKNSAKQLPTEFVDALAEQSTKKPKKVAVMELENSGDDAPPTALKRFKSTAGYVQELPISPIKKRKRPVELGSDKCGDPLKMFKSAAGMVKELPMSPIAKKKKTRTINLASGPIVEEQLTPKRNAKVNGFHESPITPRTGFKVRQMLTAGQDEPPKMPPADELRKKELKRKQRMVDEPMLTLPKPKWTQSGIFLEEIVPVARSIEKVGATEFMISSLAKENKGILGGGTHQHKNAKKTSAPKKHADVMTSAINANALNFKKNALNWSNIPRESSRDVLQRKERANKHKHF